MLDTDGGSAGFCGVAGFSSEVSFSSSGVAETKRVRQINSVETTSAMLHATPPSMPYVPPVSHAGPASSPINKGLLTIRSPLIGKPKIQPSAQFQPQCTPRGNH